MISNLEEFLSAKGHVLAIQKELSSQAIRYDPQILIGTMIEVPSAAINADILTSHADFVSIGTNDLTQYTLAVDRLNVAVSYLYNHFDPAVIRLVKHTLQAARQNQTACSICGEMAADPLAIPLLLGLGLRIDACQKLTADILRATSAKEVVALIHRWIPETYAEWVV